MFAVMALTSSGFGAQFTMWLGSALLLAVLLLGTLTAPTHVRRFAGAMAVALVLAGVLLLPNIIMQCGPYIWCWWY